MHSIWIKLEIVSRTAQSAKCSKLDDENVKPHAFDDNRSETVNGA